MGLSSRTLGDYLKVRKDNNDDPLELAEKPKHLSNVKAIISGSSVELVHPERDPRYVQWCLQVDDVSRVMGGARREWLATRGKKGAGQRGDGRAWGARVVVR